MSFSNTQHRISDSASNLADTSKDFVAQHAIPTTMAAFGAGLGAGIALVFLMSNSSRYQGDAGVANRLGRQVLDALTKAVPSSLTNLGR